MTRKDYQMIAEAIRDVVNASHVNLEMRPWDALVTAAEYIADGLAADNPRFDRKRFMAACGFDA